MRAATLRRFRKLWGRIDQDIPAGTMITVQIQNRCSQVLRALQHGDVLKLFASWKDIQCVVCVPTNSG
jgi:hypothetical protein